MVFPELFLMKVLVISVTDDFRILIRVVNFKIVSVRLLKSDKPVS